MAENLKRFQDSSVGFLRHLAKNCRIKTLSSVANNQEIFPGNKPCSPVCVEGQGTGSSIDAQKVTAKAIPAVDDINSVLSFITSPEIRTKYKLALLSDLQQKCQADVVLCEKVICSGKFVQYAEKLLCLYCQGIGHSVPFTTTSYDLHLLTELLRFLMCMADVTVHTIRELLVTQSEFLKQLIRVILRHSHYLESTLKKFETSSVGKVLAGTLRAMTRKEQNENFESTFGITIPSIDLELEGFNGIFYDTTEELVHDMEIFSADRKVHSPERDGEASKMVCNVIISYTLPPNCAFIYTDSSYKDQLFFTSSLLQAEIVDQRENVTDLRIGGVYGLCSVDVLFERMPSLNIECIRAQLLAVVSGTAIIWALDFGVFGLVSPKKLYTISSQELLMMPPLAKLCLIEGLVQEAEEKFLSVALKFLRCIEESCTHSVKSMLLSEAVESPFFLFQYYKPQIRTAVLDVLAFLAREDADIRSFMEEIRFDKDILGKLEFYAHVYAAQLCKCSTTMNPQIMYMKSILWSLFEHNREDRTLAEIERVIQVVTLFMNTPYPWKSNSIMFLTVLEKRAVNSRVSRNCFPRRQRDSSNEQRGPRERFPQENWRNRTERRDEGYFRRNLNGFNRMENDQTSSNGTEQKNSNLKMQNEWYLQQHKSYSKMNQEDAEKLIHNWRPRHYFQTDYQQRTVFNNAYFSNYTDLEDNLEEVPLAPSEAQNDTVDLSIQKGGLDYVIKGSLVSVKPDETHAFITIKNLRELKEVEFAKVLCGLLNNNTKGFLYFGITSNSVIVGITVTRSDKDTFRNGIDRVMRRCLIPEVRGHSYDIAFTQVLSKDEKTKDLRHHNLYIIELQIRPMLHTVYMVFQDRKCYVRHGTKTCEYAVIQQIQATIEAKEKEMEEAMEKLNISAVKNSEELTAFTKEYVSLAESLS